jgi:hypothetical protein
MRKMQLRKKKLVNCGTGKAEPYKMKADCVAFNTAYEYMLRNQEPSNTCAEADISLSLPRDTETTALDLTGMESGDGQ